MITVYRYGKPANCVSRLKYSCAVYGFWTNPVYPHLLSSNWNTIRVLHLQQDYENVSFNSAAFALLGAQLLYNWYLSICLSVFHNIKYFSCCKYFDFLNNLGEGGGVSILQNGVVSKHHSKTLFLLYVVLSSI